MKNIPLEEQETTITMYPKSIQDRAEIYTCETSRIAKLKKLATENPDEVKIAQADGYGILVSLPLKWINIRKPVKRNLTDEQRQALSERMKARLAAAK